MFLKKCESLRDESGARLFRRKDVLTPQQVAGFFSRMAVKTQKSSSMQAEQSESEDENQHDAVEAESLRSKLHATVEEEIALQHPIVFLSRNICSLSREKKSSTFPVKMLRELCENLGLNVDGITQRRKKPFIDLLTQLVGECWCARK